MYVMKCIKVLVFLFFNLCICFQMRADQLAYLTKDQAEKTVDYLETKHELILWCACCDYDPPRYVQFEKVGYEHTGYEDYYQVYILIPDVNNLANLINYAIDLAYVHIIDDDKAISLGTIMDFDCDPCTEPFGYNYSNAFSQKGFKKMKKLSKDFIKTLSKQGVDGIESFYPNEKQLKDFIETNPMVKDKDMIQTRIVKKVKKEMEKSKTDINRNSNEAEVDLSEMVFIDIITDHNPDSYYINQKFSFYVLAKSKEKDLKFRLKCMYMNDSWFFIDDLDGPYIDDKH